MIAKVTSGEDMRGLVAYLFGPGKVDRDGERTEVHTDQRAVAGADGLDVEFGVTLDRAAQRDLAWQLDAPRARFGTEVKDGHVYHLSLSNGAEDRVLTDGEWGQVARETMDRLGFTASRAYPRQTPPSLAGEPGPRIGVRRRPPTQRSGWHRQRYSPA